MEGTTVTMSVGEYDSLRKCKEALDAGHKYYVSGYPAIYSVIERDALIETLFKYISDLHEENTDLYAYKFKHDYKVK